MANKEKDLYQDFGEKIGGAKKDKYGIQVSDLEDMNNKERLLTLLKLRVPVH